MNNEQIEKIEKLEKLEKFKGLKCRIKILHDQSIINAIIGKTIISNTSRKVMVELLDENGTGVIAPLEDIEVLEE